VAEKQEFYTHSFLAHLPSALLITTQRMLGLLAATSQAQMILTSLFLERKLMAIVESRYTDPTPVKCGRCTWQGRIMDCTHGYAPAWPKDAEPCDYCPACGSDHLIPFEDDLVPA